MTPDDWSSQTTLPKAAAGVPSSPEDDEEDDQREKSCGWWRFRPRCLQHFRSPKWVLLCLCLAGAVQGMVVNGFVNVVITTIERRFGLRSSETGLVAGAYDIASFILLVPVSYFGGSGRKPLWLGWGMVLMGLGSLLFTLPHFATEAYNFHLEKENLCFLRNSTAGQSNNESCTTFSLGNVEDGRALSNYKYAFIASQLLHGAGATPLYTLGVTYLDESVSTKMSSLYIGIFYAMAIVGPAIGYLLGGQFLKIYSDIVRVDPASLGLTINSNAWIGAWWIGFLLSAVLSFLVAIPLLSFPKELPGAKEIRAAKISEVHRGVEDNAANQVGFGTKVKDLPSSFKLLVNNPTFMFLNLAGASEGLLLAGLAAFLPKFIESQFSLHASMAALVVGAVTVPAGGGGTFLGGYVIKKLDLRCSGIIKLCVGFSLASFLCCFLFINSCPNIKFAGVNIPYGNSSANNNLPNITGECAVSRGCVCQQDRYDPICGVDNVMYYSPCHAGCQASYNLEGQAVFVNCSCVQSDGKIMKTITNASIIVTATRDKCESTCTTLALFLAITCILMVFTFLVSMPALSATLRCVAESQRSFGLGIQWIIVRLLGMIPAPVIFGAVTDLTCLLWEESCGYRGSCRSYDNKLMSRFFLIIVLSGKGISVFAFAMAAFLYKAPVTSSGNGKVEDGHPSIHISTISNNYNNSSEGNTNSCMTPIDDAVTKTICHPHSVVS